MNRPRLSIITAIHNALPMNRFYWEVLSQHTRVPFELIVVDNHSTDGSETFFQALARDTLPHGQQVVYLRNEFNQSYPASQNQGLRCARADILCFFNNDIWMPREWHTPFEALLAQDPCLVLSPSGQEAQPTRRAISQLMRRWKRTVLFSKVWRIARGRSEMARLWKMLEWMYGDMEHFRSPTVVRDARTIPGINGSAVIFHRTLLHTVPGIWDERFHAADWHLYLTMAQLHERDPQVPLPQIVLDCYMHHFVRYTTKQKYEPYHTGHLVGLHACWTESDIQRLWWGRHLPES
jgi:glycosyltransferase involved in cell wall biosynthesis